MKKIWMFAVFTIFMFSLISAGVTMATQPKNLYNLGDKIEFDIKIVSEGLFSEFVTLKLRCGNLDTEIYKEYLYINEDTTKKIIVPLVKEFIGESKGSCAIFSTVDGEENKLSNDFSISTNLKFTFKSPMDKLDPGQDFTIEGTVYRENGVPANGIIEARMSNGEAEDLFVSSEVVSGVFSLNFSLPEKFSSGDHVINFYAYERNELGDVTNFGNGIDTVVVRQIPTNIEVVLEEKKIVPGESLKARVLLHDQSGEKIDAVTYIAIKDEEGAIVSKLEKKTGVLFEYPINYTQAPGFWSIGAYSEEIINKVGFEILENRIVDFELINQTLLVVNKGNVPYEGLINITIGNSIIPLKISLGVGEEEKYVLTAPNGEYEIRVGDLSERIPLTGKAIDIKKYTGDSGFNLSIVWIFLIFILGFVSYTIFRKGAKRTFFGRVLKRRPNKSNKDLDLTGGARNYAKGELITPKTKVELSLSIAGTKQNSVVGCISIKNFDSIKSGEGNVHETLENIVNMVESRKGLIYKNHGNLFYIFAPVLTKTFKNDSLALDVSQNILSALNEHNKKFNKKIDFGIALNYGTIVTKVEVKDIKFMSMGTLMTSLKKMANASQGKLYMGEKVKERLAAQVKTVRKELGSLTFYEYKESVKKTDHSPFIKGFMERQQKERLAKENSKTKESLKKDNVTPEEAFRD